MADPVLPHEPRCEAAPARSRVRPADDAASRALAQQAMMLRPTDSASLKK
ncbi:hypothetical protein [Methylobacterium nonmethylotrophicum]|nr:hypothetical protein [Methylobacterium nonmethylotrophicum]